MIGLILIVSFILDWIFTNIFSYQYNNLSLFTPLITIVSLFLIYPLFKKNKNRYFITLFIVGIIYDLLFTNLIIINRFLFLLIGYISKYIHDNFKLNILTITISIIVIISIYETSLLLIFVILRMYNFSITDLLYKITHSLLLNILYGIIGYYILSYSKKKIT